MVRSSGFGSTSCNYLALFRLAFASAPVLNTLTSLHNVTRRPVLQKVRYHTISSAISACKHKVSGSLSLPSRGSFHLSLTVLFAIGHMVVFSLRRWSSCLPSGFLVSRRTPDTPALRMISLTGLLPSSVRLSNRLQLPCSVAFWGPYPARIATCGLGSSDFARHYFRNRSYFLFLRVLRCFSSPGSPHLPMDSVNDNTALPVLRSRIRTSADLSSFAAPRSFSQLVTSFFGA